MIYLDHNATTPLDIRVRQAMLEVGEAPLNPSSVHSFGRQGKSLIEKARRQISKLLGIGDNIYKVIFTSGGTEANNLVIKNFTKSKDDKILISAIEHASIFEQQNILANIDIIAVNSIGVVEPKLLETKLASKNYKLVSVMLANNETGIIQPIEEIAEITHKYGALMHCDATCATGKIAINLPKLGADFLTISAHKFGGPKAAGALIWKADLMLDAQIYGGRQEYALRAGTENVEAIVGFGKAAELAGIELEDRFKHLQNLQQKLEDNLDKNFAVKIIGKQTARLPNTTLITAETIDNQTTVINLDLKGVAVSSGSACSSGKVGTSHVLQAMGIKEKEAKSAIRISLGYQQKITEVEEFVKICLNHQIFPKKQ